MRSCQKSIRRDHHVEEEHLRRHARRQKRDLYTPLAIDTALLFPRQFRCTISVRFKATRDATSLAEEFESHLYDVFHQERVVGWDENGKEEKRKLIDILSY